MARTPLSPGVEEVPVSSEIGGVGLRQWSGYVREEFLTELTGTRGIQVYREMSDNDAIVGAILFAIRRLVGAVRWRIKPGGPTETHQDDADFVQSCIADLDEDFDAIVEEVTSMVTYGWAAAEMVYKVRGGPESPDLTRRSKFSDGRIGWRRWGFRAQTTLHNWEFDENDELVAMRQYLPNPASYRLIPADRLVHWRTSIRKGNPEGRSALRNAYQAWYRKTNLEFIESIGIERDLVGYPVLYVPAAVTAPNAPANVKAEYSRLRQAVVNMRRDEQEGMVLPSDEWESGKRMYEMTLLTTGGQRSIDPSKAIERYSRNIAMTVLADWVMLGHENVGSFALSDGKMSIFEVSLKGWLRAIAAPINRHAIPQLLRYNGMRVDEPPTLEPDDIERMAFKDFAEALAKLSGAGMPLFPDPAFEDWVRKRYDLPEAGPELVRDAGEEPEDPGPGAGAGEDDPEDDE